MYDPVKSYRNTADANAALPKWAKIHKIVLINGTLSAIASLAVHDAATVTGDPVAELKCNDDGGATWTDFAQTDFDPPLFLEVGGSFNVTGTSAVYYVYYTR
jgi:hypothetical protein